MQEIDRISQMEEEESINPYEVELARWIAQDPNMQRILDAPINVPDRNYDSEPISSIEIYKPYAAIPPEPDLTQFRKQQEEDSRFTPMPKEETRETERKKFALTPLDKGYYDTYDEKPRNRGKC